MKTIASLIAVLFLSSCTTMDIEKNGDFRATARGDSQSSELRCETMEWDDEGNRTGGTNCIERVITGGQGGAKVYEMVGTIAGLFFSVASVVIQALR